MTACIRPGLRSCFGELIYVNDSKRETSVLKADNTDSEGLVRTFVEYLHAHGYCPIVDGQKGNLADFLVFESVAQAT